MAIVPFKRFWTSKPPLGTPVDSANPAAEDLLGFWCFNEGGGKRANNIANTNWTGGVLNTLSTGGRLSDRGLTTTTGFMGLTQTGYPTYERMTLLASVIPTNISGYWTIAAQAAGGIGANSGFCFRQDLGKLSMYKSAPGGSNYFLATSTASLILGKINKVACCHNSDILNVRLNGVTNSTSLTRTLSHASASVPFQIADYTAYSSGAYPWKGTIEFLIYYRRLLSGPEIDSVLASPWQLIQPMTIWLLDSDVVIRSLTAQIVAASVTGSAILTIDRAVQVLISATTITPSASAIIIRDLIAEINATSAITDTALTILHGVGALIASGMTASDAMLYITREMSARVDNSTITSAALLALASLGLVNNPVTISLTAILSTISATPELSTQSLTPVLETKAV